MAVVGAGSMAVVGAGCPYVADEVECIVVGMARTLACTEKVDMVSLLTRILVKVLPFFFYSDQCLLL